LALKTRLFWPKFIFYSSMYRGGGGPPVSEIFLKNNFFGAFPKEKRKKKVKLAIQLSILSALGKLFQNKSIVSSTDTNNRTEA